MAGAKEGVDDEATTAERGAEALTVERGPAAPTANNASARATALEAPLPVAGDARTVADAPAPTRLADDEVVARLRAVPKVGRFTILRPLGEGGMGTVSLAYDEELDRKVALKMIRGRFAEDLGLRKRFLREGQALARLSHPNVVTIYEVGEDLGLPFLAMELVEGGDLRAWLRAAKRAPREIVRVFCGAGRGLAAAHAAGIIHRDFKPTNVLVGDDGRVRVVDFGLARAAEGSADSPALGAGWASVSGSDDTLTAVGAVLGTPAYMAPEQLLGDSVDARCDQYAFAVALYEALCGVRPTSGKTLKERRARAVEEPLLEGDLSPRLRRILRRALDPSPLDRYPSMDALLADLSADPRRWWARAAVGLALVSGVAFASLGAGAPVDPCAGGQEHLRGAWDPEIADRLEQTLGGEDTSHRAGERERLVAILGEHAESWIETERAACRAHQAGESSGATLDERSRCLAKERDRLRALVETVIEGGREAGSLALDPTLVAARRLRAPSECLEIEGRRHGPPPLSPEVKVEVEALRAELVEVEVASSLRPSAETLSAATELLERARELGAMALEAEALYARGRLRVTLGHYEEAAEDLERALWMSEVIDDPARAAWSMASLVHLLGDRLERGEEAMRWRPHADALVERLGDGSLPEAHLSWAFGAVALRRRDVDRAIVDMRRALTVAEAQAGPESLVVAGYLGNLGAALGVKRDFVGAREALRRSLEIMEASLGPEHSNVMTILGNLANIHIAVGETVEALAILRDLLGRTLRSRGEEHPETALVRQSLARALIKVEAWEPAKEQLRLAVEVQRARLGPHRELISSLVALSRVESELGEHGLAREHAAQRLTVAEELGGADGLGVFQAYETMAERELAADDPAGVLRVVAEALELPRDQVMRDSPDTIFYLRYHRAWALARGGQRKAAAAEAAEVYEGLASMPEVYAEELEALARIRATGQLR